MSNLTLQASFISGELSPSLSCRVDLAKYGQGCRTMLNFKVQPHGGAVKRPGFLLLDELPGEARLVKFAFNQEQSYCLALGEKWMRVFVPDGPILGQDGRPYQITTPYTLEQAKALSVAQSGDVLFMACHGAKPMKLMRYGHTDWEIEAMDFGPPIAQAADLRTVFINDAKKSDNSNSPATRDTMYTYSATLVDDDGKEGEAYSYTPESAITNAGTKDNFRDGLAQAIAEMIPGTTYDDLKGKDVSALSKIASDAGLKTDDLGISEVCQVMNNLGGGWTLKYNGKGTWDGLMLYSQIEGPASNGWQSGDRIVVKVRVPAGVKPKEVRIYRATYGGRPGYVGTAKQSADGPDVYEFSDGNVTATAGETPPKYEDPFPSGDYPGVVSFYEQRLVFASSPNRPQTLWMSKTGDYENFAVYDPKTDECSVEMTLASSEVSQGLWLVALRSLILGTSSMEWEITSTSGAFTAKTAKASAQSYTGSKAMAAIVAGNAVMHVVRSGSQVRYLKYDFSSDSYGGSDLTIMASHLFEKYRISDWTYQQSPDSIIWVVREDGTLAGLTFQAEHEVYAWHRTETAGRFKAICTIPTTRDDALFTVVERGGRFLMERQAEEYIEGDYSRFVFLDSAMVYDEPGRPVKTLRGLDHLEGMTVGILAGGAVEARQVVRGGAVTLEEESALAIVGLPYQADLETMPIELNGDTGATVGRKKYINEANIFFHRTANALAGPSFDQVEDIKWRDGDTPMGTAPRAKSGVFTQTLSSVAENVATVCVRSDTPTPMTVLAIAPGVQVK